MISPASLVIRESTFEAGGRCIVCGQDIPAGEGITARYGERTLRFKCRGCVARFEADPDRFLDGHPDGCCEDHDHDDSPASEWRCD